MAKINLLKDEVLKDEYGNGIFKMQMVKEKFIGKNITYNFSAYRNEEKKISGCILEKIMLDGEKKYIFDLRFDETNPHANTVKYRKIDVGYDQTFDALKSDVMFNKNLKKEELNILKEFDRVMWIESKHSQSKSTLIDVFTDIIDTTERDDTEIDGVKISDAEVIHVATKGFFAETKANIDHVEF